MLKSALRGNSGTTESRKRWAERLMGADSRRLNAAEAARVPSEANASRRFSFITGTPFSEGPSHSNHGSVGRAPQSLGPFGMNLMPWIHQTSALLADAELCSRSRGRHLMSMPQMVEPWTVSRWRELEPEEGKKFEVVEGELVVSGVPPARHARAVEALARSVAAFVRESGVGELLQYWAPVFVNQFNVFLPDFVVFPP